MAGLLARDSSSRRLPGLPTSDIMPFVLAYSGGSAGESCRLAVHPSSLSSPCGHRDPLFNCHATELRYHAPGVLSRTIVVGGYGANYLFKRRFGLSAFCV